MSENAVFRITLIAFVAASLSLTGAASAQDWPTRPMTLIVPFAAGGGVDTSARLQAAKMGELLGQSIIAQDVGRGAGTTGASRVAKSAPAGYTFVIGTSGPHAFNHHT